MNEKKNVAKSIDKMSINDIEAEMLKLFGRPDGFGYTSDWNSAIKIAISTGILFKPRYLIFVPETQVWQVREQASGICVSRDKSGPVAICRAILIRVKGKGSDYSDKR